MRVHTYHAPDRVQREQLLRPRLGHVQGVKVKPGRKCGEREVEHPSSGNGLSQLSHPSCLPFPPLTSFPLLSRLTFPRPLGP